MVGTFGGALEARQISARDWRLSANVRGEVEAEDGTLVIRRIHVEMLLAAPEDARPVVERVHEFFARKCPVYRSLQGSIEISSSFKLV